MISFGALLPHPPIVIPGIGRERDLEQAARTIESMREIDSILERVRPDTIIVFTPHGTVYADAFIIYGDQWLSGGLHRFGLNKTWKWQNDLELAERITDLGHQAGLPVYLMDQITAGGANYQEGLDHGVLVPLSFFNPAWAERTKLIVIPLSFLPLEELYQFGTIIQEAAKQLDRKVAVIASGDLSHCLSPEAPEKYDPRGAEFDQSLVELLRKGDPGRILGMDPVLVEKAAQCGYRSIIMLLGVMDKKKLAATVHSYEGPFGVGYAVASFRPDGSATSLLPKLIQARKDKVEAARRGESPLVQYARQVVESYIKGEPLGPRHDLEEFLNRQAGAFVSIKEHGELRGCIGTTEPTQPNVVLEVKQNAIAAATRDPRFSPIEAGELPDLVFSVDLLGPAEPISDLTELDPARYGVIVSKGYRKGLLLPNLEGIETAAEQVAIAKRKAGIALDEDDVQLERFEVVRYH